MNLVSLVFVFCCTAAVVTSQGVPDIRRISILELLSENPSLKAELAAKIKASKATEDTTKAPAPPVTTTPATTTTTTPAPQADTPPPELVESTTPAGRGQRRRGNRRNGGGRRRNPALADSEKFAEGRPPHRLRVVKEETSDAQPAPQRQNGRRFPGST